MKSFATKEKRSALAPRKARPYIHHPMGPVQQEQRAAMRKILRPDEVQAKPDIGENDGKYEQEADHVAADLPFPAISGMPPGGLGGAPSLQRSDNEEPREELQRQPEEEEEEPIQAKLVQRQPDNEEEEESGLQMARLQRQPEGEEEEEILQTKLTTSKTPTQIHGSISETENHTDLPSPLKGGLEALSGTDLSGVRVHNNSSKPVQLNALAYTQGRDIHVGPSQEKHLPHEGWHAVQQMQGRVKPTIQTKGVSINDDEELEREADVMEAKALQMIGAEQATTGSTHQGSMSLQREVGTKAESEVPEKAIGTSGEKGRLNFLSVQRQVIQCTEDLRDNPEFLRTLPSIRQLMEIFVMEEAEWRMEHDGRSIAYTQEWVYGSAGTGHLRRLIRVRLLEECRQRHGDQMTDAIYGLQGNASRIAQLRMYLQIAQQNARRPDQYRDISDQMVRDAERDFRIPRGGWDDIRPADSGERTIGLAMRSLRGRMRQLEDPETIAHIQNTLDMFIDDQDEDSHLSRDQIDLPLVIAIANRESGRFDFLSTGDEMMTSAGPDAARGGQGGLDNAGNSRDEFPSEIRDEIIPFVGNPRLERQIRPRRRGRVNPARMPARNMLAGYIVEIERYRQRFERRLRRSFRRILTDAQIDQLLARMSTPGRRAWIQAAFGSRLDDMLSRQRNIIGRHLRTSSSADPLQEVLSNDRLNLNAIVTTDTVMQVGAEVRTGPHAGERSHLSGHRTRVTAAEAGMMEQALPPSLLNYRQSEP